VQRLKSSSRNTLATSTSPKRQAHR
jgi:hypothetical protein